LKNGKGKTRSGKIARNCNGLTRRFGLDTVDEKVEDVVRSAQDAAVLVLVY